MGFLPDLCWPFSAIFAVAVKGFSAWESKKSKAFNRQDRREKIAGKKIAGKKIAEKNIVEKKNPEHKGFDAI